MKLQKNKKKYFILLMDFIDYLYDKFHKGNDLSHYFNNKGLKKENLPDKIRGKFLKYSNGDNKYNFALLVMASFVEKIQEKEKLILNIVIKNIIGFDKKIW